MLNVFHRRVAALPRATRLRLMDSGIAGTTSEHTFMFGTVRWLASGDDELEPIWRRATDAGMLALLIRAALLPAEWDSYDNGTIEGVDWLRFAAGITAPNRGLNWLLHQSSVLAMRDAYDAAELPIAWHIRNSTRATTNNHTPVQQPALRRSFRRLPPEPMSLLNARPGSIQRLAPDDAQPWLDCCKAALAARCREVAPTMYANPDEVFLCDLGEGCAVCVVGAHPDDRLALEANYGYVMFSNGIPIGYGGVTPLADQANTGANIFEEFRGSEAPLLFAHSLRAFRALFGVSRFVVNPYQFGADNDEALLSGAFWFYDRIGFRAAKAAVRHAVRDERSRLQRAPGRRSSLRTLKTFAASDLVLDLTHHRSLPLFNEQHLQTIGALVTRTFSGLSAASRRGHLLSLALEQKRLLTRSAPPLTAVEQRGAYLMTPVIELVRDSIERWSVADKELLWRALRAKGARGERQFVQLSRTHGAFWQALSERCVRSRVRSTS